MRYYIIDSGDGTQFRKLSEVRRHIYLMSTRDMLDLCGCFVLCYIGDKLVNIRTINVTWKGDVTFSRPLPDYYII